MFGLAKSNTENISVPVVTLYDQISTPFFQEFDRMFDEFFGNRESILNRVKQSGYPKLEIRSLNDEFRVRASVPGVPKENLTIECDKNIVTISGYTDTDTECKNDSNAVYHVRELVKSKFSRSFVLPEDIDLQQEPITQLKDGILSMVWKYQEKPKEKPTIKRLTIS